MLHHHSSKPYAQSASEAAIHARANLEALFVTGRTQANRVIQQVESDIPTDQVVKGTALRWCREDNGPVSVVLPEKRATLRPLHPHALRQVASKAEIPSAYAQKLSLGAPWENQLLVHLFNQTYAHSDARYLLRSVRGEVRGFLSNRYRRLDSRPLVDAFGAACQEIGAQPVAGHAMDTKIALKAIIPQVFEPVPGEVMAFGVMLENSDYGNGALSLRTFVLRLWCTNFAIRDENLRRVHLGARLEEDLTYSDRTYALDGQTIASAIRDIVGQCLSPESIEEYQNLVRAANAKHLSASWPIPELKKLLTQDEHAAVDEAFNSPDIENLPPGNNFWRMSNAVSWIAGKAASTERMLELQRVAGRILDRAA